MRNCPVCNIKNPVILTKLKRKEYTQCQTCGLYYTHGDTEDFTTYYDYGRDGKKNYHDDYLNNANSFSISLNLAKRIASLAHISYQGKEILEVGASGGFFLQAVKRLGAAKIQGIEISEVAAAYGNKHGTPTICANFEAFVGKGQWDMVITIHTLEHFVRPVEAIAKIRSLLKPEALWITQHPDADVYPGVLFHVRDHTPREHLQLFDEQTILAATPGFERILYQQESPGQSISVFKKI